MTTFSASVPTESTLAAYKNDDGTALIFVDDNPITLPSDKAKELGTYLAGAAAPITGEVTAQIDREGTLRLFQDRVPVAVLEAEEVAKIVEARFPRVFKEGKLSISEGKDPGSVLVIDGLHGFTLSEEEVEQFSDYLFEQNRGETTPRFLPDGRLELTTGDVALRLEAEEVESLRALLTHVSMVPARTSSGRTESAEDEDFQVVDLGQNVSIRQEADEIFLDHQQARKLVVQLVDIIDNPLAGLKSFDEREFIDDILEVLARYDVASRISENVDELHLRVSSEAGSFTVDANRSVSE